MKLTLIEPDLSLYVLIYILLWQFYNTEYGCVRSPGS